MKKNDKWAVLAGLRWLLALIVVGVHLPLFFATRKPLAIFCRQFGHLELVLTFFLVSGYSIAHSISTRPHRYYVRRFKRIAPVFYLCYIAAWLPYIFGRVLHLPGGRIFLRPNAQEAVCGALMLGSLVCPYIDTFGMTWSLVIEWWLYMLAPVFLKRRRLVYVLSVLSALAYLFGPHFGYAVWFGNVGFYNFCAVSWTWLVGWISYVKREREWSRVLLVLFPGFMLWRQNAGGGDWAVLAICCFCCVIAYCERVTLHRHLARLLNYLGALSYPLYLVHIPVGVFLYFFLPRYCGMTLTLPIYYSGTLLATVVIHRLEIALDSVLGAGRESMPSAPQEKLTLSGALGLGTGRGKTSATGWPIKGAMRRLLVGLLAVGAVSGVARMWLSTSLAPPCDTSACQVQPLSWWQPWREACHDLFSQPVHQDCRVAFLGDSITQNWTKPAFGLPVFQRYFAPLHAYNYGVGGDRTGTLIWRLRQGQLRGIHPRLVVLMIGTNNLADPDNSIDIARGVAMCVAEVKRDVPGAHILLLGILPRSAKGDLEGFNDLIARANKLISGLANSEGVSFLDLSASFLDARGQIIPSLYFDGLHPNRAGYEALAARLAAPVRRYAGLN